MTNNMYPVLDSGLAFFNHAGVSPLPADVAQAVHDYATQAGRSGYFGSTWADDMADFRQVSAELIGARSANEIAFVPNTATGVSVSAGALNLQDGDRILVTDAEYPSNRHFYNSLQQRGVELDVVVQQDDGRIPTEDIISAVSARTRFVGISHVQWGSGFRSNLRPIADAVHAVGGLLSVDAIQSAGALPVNVAKDRSGHSRGRRTQVAAWSDRLRHPLHPRGANRRSHPAGARREQHGWRPRRRQRGTHPLADRLALRARRNPNRDDARTTGVDSTPAQHRNRQRLGPAGSCDRIPLRRAHQRRLPYLLAPRRIGAKRHRDLRPARGTLGTRNGR